MHEIKTIKVNGVTLAYREYGTGDKYLLSTQNFFFKDSIFIYSYDVFITTTPTTIPTILTQNTQRSEPIISTTIPSIIPKTDLNTSVPYIPNSTIPISSTIIEEIPTTSQLNNTVNNDYFPKKENGGVKAGHVVAIVAACIFGVWSSIAVYCIFFYKGVKSQVSSESTIAALKSLEIS